MADRGTAEVTGDRVALAETLREMSRRMVGDTGREGRNYEGIQGTAGDGKQAGRRKGQGEKRKRQRTVVVTEFHTQASFLGETVLVPPS